MTVRRESTIIDYHAPFDQGFSDQCVAELQLNYFGTDWRLHVCVTVIQTAKIQLPASTGGLNTGHAMPFPEI